jgi:hypothetical protein
MSTAAWAWEGHPGRRVFEDRRLQNSLGVLASLMSETDHRKGQLVLSTGSGAVLDRRGRALTHANEVRVARAKLKQELREGTFCIGPILAAPPEHVSTAKGARPAGRGAQGRACQGGTTPQQGRRWPDEDGWRTHQSPARPTDRTPPQVPRGSEAVIRGR